MTKSLKKIRDYALRLREAISSRWARDCHSGHEIKLYLEDRIKESSASKRAKDVRFKVIFVHQEPSSSSLVYNETIIEIDQNDQERPHEDVHTASKVKFKVTTPYNASSAGAGPDVQNICLELCRAKQEHHLTLAQLLQPESSTSPASERCVKLSPRGSVNLALTLASTMLQLNTTL